VTKFGGSIDELEIDLLEGVSGGLVEEGLSEGEDSLLDTDSATLDHDKVLSDNTIANKSTHGIDVFLREIGLCGTGVLATMSDSVDLLVDLGSVMVSVLTGSGNGELDARWMPSSNTGNLSETFVGLSGKTSGSPTSGNSFKSLTFRNSDDVNHLVLLKNGVDRDCFLEEIESEINLLSNGLTAVDLNLHDVSSLASQMQLSDLSVSNDTDDGTVLLHSKEITFDGARLVLGLVFESVLSESLLLGSIPVLVETTSAFVREMLSPDGTHGSKALGSLFVANKSNNNHRWTFDDGDCLNNFLFVEF